jgi:hypothetical protein
MELLIFTNLGFSNRNLNEATPRLFFTDASHCILPSCYQRGMQQELFFVQ